MKFYFATLLCCAFVLSNCGKTQQCIDYDKVDNITVCTNDYNPVCGCDNISYQNKCFAEKAGVVSWIGGPCP